MPDYLLPDVGEGLTEAEIVEWKVAVGDTVALNQVIVEIETAKSLVELPSPFDGVVSGLLAGEGETVAVGAPIVRFAGGDADAAPEPAPESVSEGASGAVLVGYGSSGAVPSRRRRGARPAARSPHAETRVAATGAAVGALAAPPVRKLAKELGVLIARVKGTGASGRVTRDDVMRAAEPAAAIEEEVFSSAASSVPGERIRVAGVRKATARAMVLSASSAPHVSVFLDVDATLTMERVASLKASKEFDGVRVSPLLVAAQAVIWAARRNPMVNAAWAGTEIAVFEPVNLGIAAATPRGLVVPNVPHADELSTLELAIALEQLTTRAREGRTQPADMANGTITITNLGSFGVDTGTPILNPGEAAILALGTIKQKPWVVDGRVVPRFVTTVGGSFDHRVVDGDVASRFIADVGSILEDPARLLS